jgi:hypothetical protein
VIRRCHSEPPFNDWVGSHAAPPGQTSLPLREESRRPANPATPRAQAAEIIRVQERGVWPWSEGGTQLLRLTRHQDDRSAQHVWMHGWAV